MRQKSLKQAEELNKVISSVNNKDELTGVGNNNAFEEVKITLNKEIEKNPELELGVLICDISDLKKLNDKKGIEAGDTAVKMLCKFTCDTFKHSPVFRIQGGEFAVILQGIDFKNILQLMGKLEEKLDNLPEDSVQFKAGIGFSSMTPGEKNIGQIIKKAEKAMTKNKKRR